VFPFIASLILGCSEVNAARNRTTPRSAMERSICFNRDFHVLDFHTSLIARIFL
jgi:hypothetical protein